MKIIQLSLMVAVSMGMAFATNTNSTAPVTANNSLTDALTKGKTSINFRSFYFNGDRDNRSDRIGLAVGGIMKYEIAPFYGLKLGAAYYGSYDVLRDGYDNDIRGDKVDHKSLAGSTEMLNSDGSSIAVLAEAYMQYNISNTLFKLGRQRLNTPFIGDYYNRFLPNSYEALLVENKDISDTTFMGVYITRWKYKASDKFIGMTEGVGLDEDIMFLGAINKSIPNTKIQAYYYVVPDAFNTIYFQANNKKFIAFNGGEVCAGVQYLNQQDTGDAQLGALDTYLAGMKLGIKLDSGFSLKGMYDKVGDDTIVGSGTYYSKLGWNSFINFTDIQIDGEALNAGAESYGGVLGYAFSSELNAALKFVHIEQDLTQASKHTKNTRPSSDEWNIDIKYKINQQSKIRIRFANIDYESTHKNEFDENNLRIIYDYKF